MALVLDPLVRRRYETGLDTLAREFEGRHSRERIERLGEEELSRILEGARFPDFVPTLAYRGARERLLTEHEADPTAA